MPQIPNSWPIKSYPKGLLAEAYFPDCLTHSATNLLNFWIKKNEKLSAALQLAGYNRRQRIFTPEQTRLLFEYLGEP